MAFPHNAACNLTPNQHLILLNQLGKLIGVLMGQIPNQIAGSIFHALPKILLADLVSCYRVRNDTKDYHDPGVMYG